MRNNEASKSRNLQAAKLVLIVGSAFEKDAFGAGGASRPNALRFPGCMATSFLSSENFATLDFRIPKTSQLRMPSRASSMLLRSGAKRQRHFRLSKRRSEELRPMRGNTVVRTAANSVLKMIFDMVTFSCSENGPSFWQWRCRALYARQPRRLTNCVLYILCSLTFFCVFSRFQPLC